MAEINNLLNQATELDLQARDLRKQAGTELIKYRQQNPFGGRWYTQFGLDGNTARLLIEMATGGRLHDENDI